jgi:alpha-1,2-mannosyltransferase
MARFLDLLRGGDWLTSARMRLWALAVLVAAAGGLLYLVATSDGLMDYQDRPLGTDFSNVYAAGTYVLEGRPAAPFDPRLQHAREREIFGEKTPFYGWHYPPFFLWLAAALALMPYQLALVVWQAATLVLYLLSIRTLIASGSSAPSPPSGRLRPSSTGYGGEGRGEGVSHSRPDAAPHPAGLQPADLSPIRASTPVFDGLWGRGKPSLWLLLALAYPAVFVNLGHGHNGFLTAALIGFALIHLDTRPVLAGILFGLLAYKPQFGIMIPLVLIATGRWRTVFAAGATVALLTLVATLVFGTETWRAFFTFAEYTRVHVLETGETGWHKIQSVFSWARMWGASVPLAYAVQGAVTIVVAGAVVWLWRSSASFALKAAALCLAAILATPYSLDYDLMVLAPAIAFLARDGLARGFCPYEKTALAFLWVVPLFARGLAQATFIPCGVIAMLVMFALVMRKAAVAIGEPRIAA